MPQAVHEGGTAVAVAAPARTLHLTNPLLEGDDVRQAQRLLAANPYGDFHPGEIDGVYGPATADAARRAKLGLGYPQARVDDVCGAQLLGYLEGGPLPAAFQARRATRLQTTLRSDALRSAIVELGRWGIEHEPEIHYRQLRPMDGVNAPRKLPLETDCSGFVTLCYRWAGASDPNGANFNGTGYTGTLLRHCRQIARAAVRPADLVVWGPFPGHHVAMVLEAGSDPVLVSHGQERGPLAIRFSQENGYQPAPATWLNAID